MNIPIGGIIGWAKSFTPINSTLPHGFVEANGQTLSDINSPLNGEIMPSLNNENKVLVGSSSSGETEDGVASDGSGNIFYTVWIIRVK